MCVFESESVPSSSSFIFFINLLHWKIFSIILLYQGWLAPVHRWGFSTSAVTGPKQGGRLALPPGVAKDKDSKSWSKRNRTKVTFYFLPFTFLCWGSRTCYQVWVKVLVVLSWNINLLWISGKQEAKPWHAVPSVIRKKNKLEIRSLKLASHTSVTSASPSPYLRRWGYAYKRYLEPTRSHPKYCINTFCFTM